ncbi:HEAT repeat protein [Anaerosolibacter carboniphilus]|uniref:HEAT repeat protein n=1 Tax=Anaerosolibacter carboniphilus TaxID=1417629 RepID=A0A841KRH8_9FIRM|nr:HEAT repeat domain-containing protein [Anaerosolibacter carboniphilus]MBB6215961.1 HEAT repeat protein [Anaerosolibacter carboniphilus]
MISNNNQSLNWEHIDQIEDYMLTYLLYREGKSVPLLAKIRRKTIEQVNEDLILAKSKLFSKKQKSKSLLDKMVEITKADRLTLIHSLNPEERMRIINDIKTKYDNFKNPEDKMMLIWIIGELNAKELLDLVYRDMRHHHGNVRRLACSALKKIGDDTSVEYLHRALMDTKPQVRQYAAKALGKLGNEITLKKIQKLLNNPNEKQYVKMAFGEAIQSIEQRRNG